MRSACIWLMALSAAMAALPVPGRAATTVYLNRCVGNCEFTGGPDNSVTNFSSVLIGAHTLLAFAHGDAAFAAVVACTMDLLRPFDIVVTTTDPSPAAHTELVIAGTPTQAGLNPGITAIAPANCAFVPNAPAFAFANSIGNDVNAICWAAASQLGSLAGLEPLFNCADVMTTLPACGPRSYRNEV